MKKIWTRFSKLDPLFCFAGFFITISTGISWASLIYAKKIENPILPIWPLFCLAIGITIVHICSLIVLLQAISNEEKDSDNTFRSFTLQSIEEIPSTVDQEVLSMSDEQIKTEIDYLKKKLGVRGGVSRCEVEGSPYCGEKGDLIALRAIEEYLGRRNANFS